MRNSIIVFTLCAGAAVSLCAQAINVTSTGVGIGTTTPMGALTVSSQAGDALNVYYPGDNVIALQTTLDGQSIGTYGGSGNRLLLQPVVGTVGIGTTEPLAKLHVYGGILPQDAGQIMELGRFSFSPVNNVEHLRVYAKRSALGTGWETGDIYIQRTVDVSDQGYIKFTSWGIALGNGDGQVLTVATNSNVGIGTVNPTEKLTVNGKVKSRGYITDTSGWSDYVFNKDYKLPTLTEVEQHIAQEGHLPGIPSEKEVVTNGVDLGEMAKAQMAQIEQLMLYVIALNKQVQVQADEIRQLKEKSAAHSDMIAN